MRTPAPALVLVATLLAAGTRAEVAFFPGDDAAAELPFSAAVRVDDTYYLSGQVGVKPGSDLALVEGGITAETRQVMDNIGAVLAQHGLGFEDVVKCTVMLADIAEWSEFNVVYTTYFEPPYPARSAFGASGLALGARVELECMAVAGAR